MAISEQTRVWEKSTMEGSALLVLLAIADSADKEYGHGWPGRAHLKQYGRLKDEATVSRILQRIQDAGELIVARAKGKSNHYIVLVDLPDAEIVRRYNRLTTLFPGHEITPDLKSLLQNPSNDPRITTSNDPVVPDFGVEPSVDPSSKLPSGGTPPAPPPKPPSKAKLDKNGTPVNNKHPLWEGFWNAVLTAKGFTADELTGTMKGNIAKVVTEIIQPLVYEPSDVLAFPLYADEHEWGEWTVNAIPARIADVRAERLKSRPKPRPVQPTEPERPIKRFTEEDVAKGQEYLRRKAQERIQAREQESKS